MRSTVVQQGLRVVLLLLHIERRQLRWCGHLTRIPPGCLRYFGNFLPVGGPNADPGLIGQVGHISRLAWEQLGVPLKEGGGVREAWPSLLRRLPLKPKTTERVENRLMEQTI